MSDKIEFYNALFSAYSALRAEKQMSDERRELIKILAVASYGHQTRPQYRATWIQEIISDADTILAALAATEKKP